MEVINEEQLDLDSDQDDLPTEEPLVGDAAGLLIGRKGKPSVSNPLGRVGFDTKALAAYQAQPIESKREYLKNQWYQLAYVTVGKANAFAMTVTKKDFGRLMQVAMASGLAFDKVFPKGETPSNPNLVLNIFNGLPRERVLAVVGSQPTPKGIALVDNTIPTANNVIDPT